jgi:hypothetical protein
MHLHLGLPVLTRAIEQTCEKDPGAMHLRDLSGFKDGFLTTLIEALRKELTSHHSASSLFIQGVAQSLAVPWSETTPTRQTTTRDTREACPDLSCAR